MGRAAEVVLKEIDSLLDELAEAVAEPAPAVVCEQVRLAGRVRDRAEAVFTTLVGHLDASGAHGDDGAVNARAWLSWELHLTRPAAGAVVANSRALRNMPATEKAFAAGSIGAAQVRLLCLARQTSAALFARDEEMLVGQAKSLRCEVFARTIKHWMYLADPDQGEDRARRHHDLRHVHLSKTFQDRWALDGVLDTIGGTIVHNELERLEREEFTREWKEAEQRLGRKPLLTELARTPAQRRADALVEMARRSRDLPDGTPRSRPLITLVIDHPTLTRVCQLADGTIVTPGQVLPLFCDCDIERVVFGANSRVIDVGEKRRFFTGATRRAIEIRDLECTHPTCDQPYEQCEIDHIQPWSQHGPTTQTNGRVHCPHHNRSRPRSQLPDPDDPEDPA